MFLPCLVFSRQTTVLSVSNMLLSFVGLLEERIFYYIDTINTLCSGLNLGVVLLHIGNKV